MKVVRIIDRLNIGGPAKHVVWLTAGLHPTPCETTLFTGTVPAGEGDMTYLAREAGVTPIVIPEMSRELSLKDALVIVKLYRQLRRIKPDIVHTHKAKAGAVGRVAAWLYRWCTPSVLRLRPRPCRVVHTYHGHVFHSYYGKVKTRLFLAIERTLARVCTDRIIVISQQQKDEIGGRFKVGRPDQLRIVPLGVDMVNADAPPTGRPTNSGIVTVGAVGRLCEVKNYPMLLDAWSRLEAGGGRARLRIVGDGHLRGGLEAQVRAAGMEERVEFAGFRRDVLEWYHGFDIVALSSLNEGTPVTLIEAMSARCPVIATEVGGVVDLLGRRREILTGFTIWDHGVTVPSGDSAAFARGLDFLISRPDLRREMGDAGNAFVRATFSIERLLNDVHEVYLELLPPGSDEVLSPVRLGGGARGGHVMRPGGR